LSTKRKKDIMLEYSLYIIPFKSYASYTDRRESLWSCSYGSLIYNYLGNRCISPLKLSDRIPFMVRWTRNNLMYHKVCQWLATGRWFSPVSSANKTDRHDIAEILLKVVLNTINRSIFCDQTCMRFFKYERTMNKSLSCI
jgi:hypothetical protein